jgi:hypothetical protein
LPALGLKLPSRLIGEFRVLTEKRNEIVHRTQTDTISGHEAARMVDTGLAIIDFCMISLLARKSTAPAKTEFKD